MSIPIGTRLGPYEIQAPLGAGGMGEVYRAEDTRLHRSVAIKVLPDRLVNDPERRQRFEREARAVARINHPHICALFDVGRHGSLDYLVMEYLEGETLARRLVRGALLSEQVLRISIEIADALREAHRSGIVHRDLKPSNVMLTRTGAKLLDFGLAKLRPSPIRDAMALTEAPTLTADGVIVGTVQYMAPEQLEGKEVDPRTDIFAFGAVLYEMATGRRAFEGESQASLIAAILDSEPAPMSTPDSRTPFGLDHVVKRCLAKDPEERWQSATDLTNELRWVSDASREARTPVTASPPTRARVWSALGIIGIILASLVTWRLLHESAPTRVSRLVLPLSQGELYALYGGLAISPDGTRVVYSANKAGEPGQLWARALDETRGTPIAGTENGRRPFFSPDGQWVGFFGEGLKKVSLSGGAPIPIAPAINAAGGSWGPDDTIVYSTHPGGLWRVSAGGGTPEILTTPDPQKLEMNHRLPHFLPGGKAVLFTNHFANITSSDDANIEVLSLETRERRVLVRGGMDARYSPTGHLIYMRKGSLLAAPFDLARLEAGSPSPVVEGVKSAPFGYPTFSFSRDGTLVFVAEDFRERRLVMADRRGEERPVTTLKERFADIACSPDGRRLALGIESANDQIWLYDLERKTMNQLTFEWDNAAPVWTPDGSRIAFGSNRGGQLNLFWIASDGSGTPERLTTSENPQAPSSFSPDGKMLAFVEGSVSTGEGDIWMLPLEGERKPFRYSSTPFQEQEPRFSPDGRWVAYQSNESGQWQVYVRPYPGPGAKWQISTEGGGMAFWTRRGTEIVYSGTLESRNGVIAVTVETSGGFRAGRPTFLFEKGESPLHAVPDGERFFWVRVHNTPIIELHVVLNWFEDVRRRVPTR